MMIAPTTIRKMPKPTVIPDLLSPSMSAARARTGFKSGYPAGTG
jgi:hypothetical protein